MYVIDITDKHIDDETVDKVKNANVPIFILLNKIDASDQETVEKEVLAWQERVPQAEIFPISALHHANIRHLFDCIIEKLPECPPYFPKDELTDKSMRFFVTEIIREKILLNYKQEIPYSVEVVVESYEESEKMINIRVVIYVSRESQKAIIIGKGGSALKKVGISARADIEEFVGKKVFLNMFVKVDKDWRDNEQELKNFGYVTAD